MDHMVEPTIRSTQTLLKSSSEEENSSQGETFSDDDYDPSPQKSEKKSRRPRKKPVMSDQDENFTPTRKKSKKAKKKSRSESPYQDNDADPDFEAEILPKSSKRSRRAKLKSNFIDDSNEEEDSEDDYNPDNDGPVKMRQKKRRPRKKVVLDSEEENSGASPEDTARETSEISDQYHSDSDIEKMEEGELKNQIQLLSKSKRQKDKIFEDLKNLPKLEAISRLQELGPELSLSTRPQRESRRPRYVFYENNSKHKYVVK